MSERSSRAPAAQAPVLPLVVGPLFALAAAGRGLPTKTIRALVRIIFVALLYLGAATWWGWLSATLLARTRFAAHRAEADINRPMAPR